MKKASVVAPAASSARGKPKQPGNTGKAQGHTARSSSSSTAPAAAAASTSAGRRVGAPLRLEVTPERGEFINYDVDTTYVISFTVRNRSAETQTLRFVAPQGADTAFRVANLQSVRLAPGLSHALDIEFSTHTQRDYEDSFVILSGTGDRVEVPLEARRVPRLEHATTVDFGLVEHTQAGVSRALRLVNRGRKEAAVAFSVRGAGEIKEVVVSPPRAVAPPMGETSVMVELAALRPGRQEWQLEVAVDGEAEPRLVTVAVDVVDSRSTLLSAATGEEVVRLDYDKVFAGNTKKVGLIIRNGSEQPISFAFQLANELVAKEAPPFRFVPEQGHLAPLERRQVTMLFEPPISPVRTGWSHADRSQAKNPEKRKFEALFSLLFVETEQVHNFHVVGESVETVAWLTRSVVDFGECDVDDYRNDTIELCSGVPDMPLRYAFDHVTNVRVDAPTGTVPPGGTRAIHLTFQPRRLGQFTGRLMVRFNDTVERVITTVGYANAKPKNGARRQRQSERGGIDKVPEDFVRPTQPPQRTDKTRSLADETITTDIKTVDLPTPVDLGMVPAQGLAAPEPASKFTARLLHAEDAAISRSSAGHVAPMTFDTKTLIKRRFSEAPTNAMERRDCRRELMPMDLLNIVFPIKLLEFDRVTIGAVAVRSFYIYNGTNASILAAMPTDEALLSFTPISQVVPAGRMAQFDVSLCSLDVQSCQQVIAVTVNNHHRMRFSTQAEIVPIEVMLSQPEVRLTFAAETANEPLVRDRVVLANNGNSEAPYRWTLPPNVPFTISPTEGVLAPMSKVTAQLTYQPPQHSPSDAACDATLEVEGAVGPKTLHLIGTVAPTKCGWGKQHPVASNGDLQLDLKRIAAGKSTTVNVVLRNRGTNNAFFSFAEPPEGMAVTPMSGRLCAGEGEELRVTLRPTEAGSVQHQLLCDVLGMRKPLRLTIAATVVAPLISVVSPEKVKGEVLLDFGEIYSGVSCERPIRIRNSGDVEAVVEVDLRAHPGYGVRVGPPKVPGGAPDVTVEEDVVEMPAAAAAAAAAVAAQGSPADSQQISSPFSPKLSKQRYYVTIAPQTEGTVLIACTGGRAARKEFFYARLHQVGADEVHLLPPLALQCVSLPAVLRLSTRAIEFPPVVSGLLAKSQTVEVHNVGPDPVEWSLEREAAATSAEGGDDGEEEGHRLFMVEPQSGTLGRRESATVKVTFLASAVGSFAASWGLYAGGRRDRICQRLSATGSANRPRLLLSQDMLCFPAIPLGCAVKETLYFYNEGFESITVSYEGETQPPLEVEFIKGNVLSINNAVVPVTLCFCSHRPITFDTSILFTTNRGERVHLAVSGTAISSILSTLPYVKTRGSQVSIANRSTTWDFDQTDAFVLTDTAKVPMLLSKQGPAPSPAPPQSAQAEMLRYRAVDLVSRAVHSAASVERLGRWMTENVLPFTGDTVVEALQASHGRYLYDCIERLFGKRPRNAAVAEADKKTGSQRTSAVPKVVAPAAAGKTSVQQSRRGSDNSLPNAASKAPKVELSREEAVLDVLLNFLGSYGCCLSGVRLQYLLPFAEYPAYLHKVAPEAAALPAAQFEQRATHAWVTVVLETLRVFYLSALRPAAFAAPALAPYVPQALWATKTFTSAIEESNVFSAEESLLLQWLRASVLQYGEKHKDDNVFAECRLRINNFDDLRDPRPYIMTILLYVPLMRSVCFEGARRVVPSPANWVEQEGNISALLTVLRELGMQSVPTLREYLDFDQINFVLFTASLARYLPLFIPTNRINFEGKLLSAVTQTIEVRNTSTLGSRSYRVVTDNPEFRVSQREFIVPPSGAVPVEVTFKPKFHRASVGQCLILDRTTGVTPDSRTNMVFDLVASPNTNPIKIINLESPLYESLSTDIYVDSPFSQDCVATLRVIQEYAEEKDAAAVYPERQFALANFRKAFFLGSDVFPLRCNESNRLSIGFIPLCRGTYTLHITFREDREGEFSYLVRAKCTMPKPNPETRLDFRCELGDSCAPSLVVRAGSTALDRALRAYEERSRQTQGSFRPTPMPDMSKNTYQVQFVNDALEGPNPFIEGPATLEFSGGASAADYSFNFKPKYVGVYSGYVVLTSPVDVRLFKYTGECVPKGEQFILRFACPARQSITQDIELNNTTDKDWLVTATLQGDGFTGPREVRIARGRSKEYTLKYAPAWIVKEEQEGSLVLYNQGTGQKHTYQLFARATEPLCEDTFDVECRSRETKQIVMMVPNILGADCTYFVETDVRFATGEKSLVVPRGTIGRYTLTVSPTVGGRYSGKVIFRCGGERYVWFIVNMNVAPPEKEGTVVLKTDSRTTVVADVRMQNPLDRAVQFKIRRFGPGLFGDNKLTLEAKETATYSCLFVPSQVGDFEGRLSFCNDDIGEFWYELRMTVEDSPPEELTFESMLGIPFVAKVKLPNRTDKECPLTVSISNPTNYTVRPPVVVLPSNGEAIVDIVYTPTAIGVPQEGTVTFSHVMLGQWKYQCKGSGTAPPASKPRTCTCDMGSSVVVPIAFKNTLDVETGLVVSFADGKASDSFVLPASTGTVPPGATQNIDVTYKPQSVGIHQTVVEVRPSVRGECYKVVWRYPLDGRAEWKDSGNPFSFHCTARKQQEQTLMLRAPGLTPEAAASAEAHFVPDANQGFVPAIRSSVACELVADEVYPDAFKVLVKFSPLRAFAGTGDLRVEATSGGGIWRYRLYLEADPAPADDTIVVKSALRVTSSASFDLYNVFPYKSKFAAYFAPGSSRDLSVSPAHGVLLPFIAGQRSVAAATTLRVNFTPSARVSVVEGILVVDTEDMQWTFNVKGKLE